MHPVRLMHHQAMNHTDGPSDARGWTADDSTFGARLALIRQRQGWGNVKEAAIACGIATETWRTWERDGVLPRNYAQVCQRISEATGADHYWLLTGTKSSGPPPPARSRHSPLPDECRPIVTRPKPPTKPRTRHNAVAA